MKKICLIGPVFPFKGGVAQHNALLYNELKKRYEVELISFKRYYPPFLYPGKEEKDNVSKNNLNFEAQYILDIMNPFSVYKTFLEIKRNRFDILILQWNIYQHAVVYLPLLYLVKKFTKTKIIVIGHNILPHKKSFLDKFITKWNLGYSDGFIVHSKKDEKDLSEIIPYAKVKSSFLPTFVDVFKTRRYSKKEAREILGIKHKKVILFFGLIREYKGLIYLIRAMPNILKKFDVLLLIAGDFWRDDEKNEIRRLRLESNVKIIDKYIPDEDIGLYFSTTDLLVQPYLTATQTAIVPIAFSFDVPAIVTDVGGLPEVVKNNKTGFVVEKMNSKELANAIIKFYNNNLSKKFIKNVKKEKERFTFNNYVKDLESLF